MSEREVKIEELEKAKDKDYQIIAFEEFEATQDAVAELESRLLENLLLAVDDVLYGVC